MERGVGREKERGREREREEERERKWIERERQQYVGFLTIWVSFAKEILST